MVVASVRSTAFGFVIFFFRRSERAGVDEQQQSAMARFYHISELLSRRRQDQLARDVTSAGARQIKPERFYPLIHLQLVCLDVSLAALQNDTVHHFFEERESTITIELA